VCKDVKHIMIKGDGHQSNEMTRTFMPTGRYAAVGQQEQQAREK
jgi:hypothetical protein